MTEIYGTLGPRCSDTETLAAMFRAGMTGVRLNLSHTGLEDAAEQIGHLRTAADLAGREARLLVDLQGPELRVGVMREPLTLKPGETVRIVAATDGGQNSGDRSVKSRAAGQLPEVPAAGLLSSEPGSGEKISGRELPASVPVPREILPFLAPGKEILLDDGKILLRVCAPEVRVTRDGCAQARNIETVAGRDRASEADHSEAETAEDRTACAKVVHGGVLTGRKSIALPGVTFRTPTLTEQDRRNIRLMKEFGVAAVMQPFVRDREDLEVVRAELDAAGAESVRILAKIENMEGVARLEEILPAADEIVIARGDLGNAMPLWRLPRVQKEIAQKCRTAGKAFMVVTQMLASMEHSPVPTRAEVSDIFNAVLDGASSVMVTGETAVGEYPAETIRYLAETVREAEQYAAAQG